MRRLLIDQKSDGTYSFQYLDSFGKMTPITEFPPDQLATINLLATFIDGLKSINESTFEYVVMNATEEEKLALISAYPIYQVGKLYKINDEFRYGDYLYKVVQQHTSQIDWNPATTPALYTKIVPSGTIPDWIQPTGAQDAYNMGDRVNFEGHIYQSLIDANVWSPTAYPAGWQLTN